MYYGKYKYKYYKENKLKAVYVILNLENERIKIGISEDVLRRYQTLMTQSGCYMELKYNTPYIKNAEILEAKAHEHFKSKRYLGEWFNVSCKEAVEYLNREVLYHMTDDDIKFNQQINRDIDVDENLKKKNKIDIKEEYPIGEAMVLNKPIASFKRIDKDIYKDKSGRVYNIKYINKQWIIRRIE